jgi:hypothetical protein
MKIPTSPGEAVETMPLSQTPDTLPIERQSPDGVVRFVLKLDGSENRYVIRQLRAKPHK